MLEHRWRLERFLLNIFGGFIEAPTDQFERKNCQIFSDQIILSKGTLLRNFSSPTYLDIDK